MFNFLNEIIEQANLPITEVINNFKYVNLAGKIVYVQGYKDVLSFDNDTIVLKLKKGEIKIEGNELNIKDININSITIEGKINSVTQYGGE